MEKLCKSTRGGDDAIAGLTARHPDLDIVFIESGGDNLAAAFSPDRADLTIHVVSVARGGLRRRHGAITAPPDANTAVGVTG